MHCYPQLGVCQPLFTYTLFSGLRQMAQSLLKPMESLLQSKGSVT